MGAGFSEYDKSDFNWGDLVPIYADIDRVANVWSICSTVLIVVSGQSVNAFFGSELSRLTIGPDFLQTFSLNFYTMISVVCELLTSGYRDTKIGLQPCSTTSEGASSSAASLEVFLITFSHCSGSISCCK